jgi:hypothetical protein
MLIGSEEILCLLEDIVNKFVVPAKGKYDLRFEFI